MLKLNKITHPSILVGGGFTKVQYFWILIVISEYCKIHKINNIVLESHLDFEIISNKIIKNKIKKINLHYEIKKHIFLLIKFFLVDFIKFYQKYKNESIFKNNFKHSFHDLCRVNNTKDQYKISFFNKIKSFLILFSQFSFIENLKKKYNLTDIFYGHNVYQHRITFALLSNSKKINYYIQANNSFYKSSCNHEKRWDFLDKHQYDLINKVLSTKDINSYWKKRNLGHSNYEDFNISSNNKNSDSYLESSNVIMLHIFQDSPFIFLDKNKLFFDYFIWLKETLKFICNSSEKWLIKFHPNSTRWGENSQKIFFDFVKKNKIKITKNISFTNDISNLSIFRNLSKLITFSGTSAIESIAYGVKPICISKIIDESNILNSYYYLPKSIKEYGKLLNSNASNFKISNKKAIFEAKKTIFIRENVISFNNDIQSRNIYRGDKINFQKKQIIHMKKDIKNNLKYFEKLTKLLSEKNIFVSKFYLKKIFRN